VASAVLTGVVHHAGVFHEKRIAQDVKLITEILLERLIVMLYLASKSVNFIKDYDEYFPAEYILQISI